MRRLPVILVVLISLFYFSCDKDGAIKTLKTVETPQFSISPGNHANDISIELTCGTPDSSIYYTTNGTTPTDSSSPYSSAIELTGNGSSLSLQAKAFKTGMNESELLTGSFSINYASPQVSITSHSSRTYTTENTITVSGTAAVSGFPTITRVELKINDADYVLATGTDSWSHSLSLTEGVNAIYVRAVSDQSVTSAAQSIAIVYSTVIYSASDGSDSNSGFLPTEPIMSIQNAVDKAISLNLTKVKIKEGLYTPGNGLNPSTDDSGLLLTENSSNLEISGGWNSDFTDNTGTTVLDGQNSLAHTVDIRGTESPTTQYVDNLTFENMTIRGGYAFGAYPNDRGAGLCVGFTRNSFLRDLTISNNEAQSFGGGLHINNSYNNVLTGSLFNNSAESGGGMYTSFISNSAISYTFESNSAAQKTSSPGNYNGGALYMYYSNSNFIASQFRNNSAGTNGGGVFFWGSNDNEFRQSGISNNSAGSNGGGVYQNNQSSNNTLDSQSSVLSNSPDNWYDQL